MGFVLPQSLILSCIAICRRIVFPAFSKQVIIDRCELGQILDGKNQVKRWCVLSNTNINLDSQLQGKEKRPMYKINKTQGQNPQIYD